MKYMRIPLVITIILTVVACSGGLAHSAKTLPDWYLNTPNEEIALYGIGEFEGADLGLTRQAAEAAARDEVARQIDIKISNMITVSKQMVSGNIDANAVRAASNQVSSLSTGNIKIISREVITSKKGYLVYALAKMPTSSLQEQAKQTLEQDEIKRQLAIDAELQQVLAGQVEKLNGLRE